MSKPRNTETPETLTLYRAETDTRNFAWEGVGRTEREARDVLRRTLREHTEYSAKECREMAKEANVVEMRAGMGLRDCAVVTGVRL